MTNSELSFVDVNPGGSETIVFLHGWPLSSAIFEYQFNTLPKYGIRCVGMDLQGFGKSEKPWNNYDYDNMSDAVHNTVQLLNLKNFTLLGFSMGGAIAARYVVRYGGENVKKLILLGAATPSFVQRPGFPYGTTREQVDGLIANLVDDKPKTLREFGETVFDINTVSPEFFNWFGNIATATPLWSARRGLESLRDEDLRADLPKINLPTAIFHGIKDRVCPYPLAEQSHNMIAGSILVPFENSGHGIFFEEKDKLNREILNFVMPDGKPAINNTDALNQQYKFVNMPLPYAYNALEPFIDELTMHLHHDRHLETYINNLNAALTNYPQFHNWTLEKLLYKNDMLPEQIRVPVARNAGGVYNHFFYFEGMTPHSKKTPEGEAAEMLNTSFGSFDEFKKQFKAKAMEVFGSGYAWLVLGNKGMPEIIMTKNQDTPLPLNMYPLLTVDVWEHAYYLKNFNMRSDYIDNWFNVVNWEKVNERLRKLK